MTDLYTDARKELGSTGDKSFCVPLALSIVTGIDVHSINHGLMAKPSICMPGKPRRVFGKGVYRPDWEQEIVDLGFRMTYVNVKGKTVSTVPRYLDPNKKYLIAVKRHLLAYAEGNIQDWSKGSRRKIEAVYEITSAAAPAAPTPAPAAPTPAPAAPATPAPLSIINALPNAVVKTSGRWITIKFPGKKVVKLTVAKNAPRLCINKNDRETMLRATIDARFTALSDRKNDVTFTCNTVEEIVDFLK